MKGRKYGLNLNNKFKEEGSSSTPMCKSSSTCRFTAPGLFCAIGAPGTLESCCFGGGTVLCCIVPLPVCCQLAYRRNQQCHAVFTTAHSGQGCHSGRQCQFDISHTQKLAPLYVLKFLYNIIFDTGGAFRYI